MRNLLKMLSLFLVLAIGFVACCKDDGDNEPITDNELYGEWKFVNILNSNNSIAIEDTTGHVDIILRIYENGNMNAQGGLLYFGKHVLFDDCGILLNIQRGDLSGQITPWWAQQMMNAVNGAFCYKIEGEQQLLLIYQDGLKGNFIKQ